MSHLVKSLIFRKMAADLNLDFKLTPKEQELIELFRQVIADKSPSTVLRIAGGWIRDRLLGRKSTDIDIAVDNMSGLAFAQLVNQWMQENNIPGVKDASVISANPEANKNLETVTMPVLGLDIDFVQLRTDSYNSDSRNPEIVTGVTPEEDARRRDLTINSLFYNINTGEVEDFTGGLEDLKQGIARTPLDPINTFLEDPLRVLRTIRFAAKYDLQPSEDLIEAAKDPRVHAALKHKISKERIWSELAGQVKPEGYKPGFMGGDNFHKAIKILDQLGLRDILLVPSEEQIERAKQKDKTFWQNTVQTLDMEQNNPHHDLTVWNHTLKALEHLNKIHRANLDAGVERSQEDQIVRNLAMLFHDYGKCDYCATQTNEQGHNTYHGHEKSSAVIAEEILTDLKAPGKIKDRVVNLIKNHMRLHVLPEDPTPKALRKVLQDVGVENWPLLVEMSKSDAMGKTQVEELPAKYDQYAQAIDDYLKNTGGQAVAKSPLNGKEIMSIFQLKPGPELGNLVKALKAKLLEVPGMTREEAIEFLRPLA